MKRSRINPISKRRRARSGIPGKLGIVRLYGSALESLRLACFERDHGCCQWPECGKRLPFDGHVMQRAHMAHIRNKRMWGDTLDNVRILCPEHHLVSEHNPKPCPKKEPL